MVSDRIKNPPIIPPTIAPIAPPERPLDGGLDVKRIELDDSGAFVTEAIEDELEKLVKGVEVEVELEVEWIFGL
jgi:hypothetical protein